MSRLTRKIDERVARIDAHQAALRGQTARFNAELGERAARPPWLIAALGAGLAGGLAFGRRDRPGKRRGERPRSESGLHTLIRQFGVPIAMNLIREYLSPATPADEPGPPAE